MRSPPRAAPADAPPETLLQELGYLYFELMMKRTDRFQAMFAEFELTATLARTLALMEPEKSATMSELAQSVYLEPSNLTGVIDKLEARGLVKRGLAATDRRVKLVSLTRSGVTLRAKIFARLREPAPWMLALSERDQRQLLLILRKGLASMQPAATKT